ncbi:hypothetical protein CXK99_20735 [Stutzerimonas stutzeri]|uniref:Uncharacterized protein n=2 Tax=Pseudomonadaceae TaxID=135621 RepID=A0A379K001_ECTOL|nr:hypothetical protein CXK99_20735 [Stutzerimonas stutzeri]SUD58026.1 Uncharacterised protein [Pseudomonas oleovorans]
MHSVKLAGVDITRQNLDCTAASVLHLYSVDKCACYTRVISFFPHHLKVVLVTTQILQWWYVFIEIRCCLSVP